MTPETTTTASEAKVARKAAAEKVLPLEFEKPLLSLEEQIKALENAAQQNNVSLDAEINRLREQANRVRAELFHNLTPAQRLQIARHPQRPNTLEVIRMLSPETWVELHGDRAGADDRAIVGGLIELDGQPCLVVGTQKGRGIKENLVHNFGMAQPEGYRKALRLFEHADKFQMPIITLIDTPGAYPGKDGEQNAIGHAIARNIRDMASLRVPIISVVMGEASSGGALGIGVANKVYMLEHSQYTVISPEGCASILWRDASFASQAAEALKITAHDLLRFGICDAIIEEPVGGAHRDPQLLGERLKAQLKEGLAELSMLGSETLRTQRYQKYRMIGAFQYADLPAEETTAASVC